MNLHNFIFLRHLGYNPAVIYKVLTIYFRIKFDVSAFGIYYRRIKKYFKY